MNRLLLRICHISAWILFILMLIFVVTGYAWHDHIIMNPRIASYIHTHLEKWMIFVFLVHSLIGARIALMRHGISGIRPTERIKKMGSTVMACFIDRRMNRFLLEICHISAWILLILMIIFIVTGHAWHDQIIMDPRTASYIHTHLDRYLIFFFLVHSLIGARIALMRHGIGPTRRLDSTLLASGVIFFLLVLMI